ncbi:kinetochore protein SPC24 homolog [Lolium rigidum]|uniref:kinetochore protein SPC24 homolog n=1 Tax=Lolium rigidum TaxID=89674 RepID=UPI001F5D47CA|nr:kinetochore protein SPC24 homolog [Lolium rigidum]
MAADAGRRVEVANLLSLGDDLIGVLLDTKDGESLGQAGERALMLRSACRSESGDLELQVKEYQEKINSCKEKIDKAKSETVTDEELNTLQNEMEEKLQSEQQLRQELRALSGELDNLDLQRASIEERKDAVKKKEKDLLKAQSMLSMCVSVTNIMPNFEDRDKISGYIVDKNKKKLDKFEFEKTMPPVEICDKLWKVV